MQTNKQPLHFFSILTLITKWALVICTIAAGTGSAVALFLWLLQKVTEIRWNHSWLLYLLPTAGVLIYFVYKYWGKNSDKGNNLLIDEIHQPGGGVPKRMAPLVLAATITTHLFGGSAGREGTAVQMGGSIASGLGKWFKLNNAETQLALMAGIAAGFGAVFGTPVAGTIFAMEVLAIGHVKYKAIMPCLAAAVMGDITCTAWGIRHTIYTISFTSAKTQTWFSYLHVDVYLLGKVVLAGILFGLCALLFAQTAHRMKAGFNKLVPIAWLVPVIGGCMIIALTYITATTDYLGLGVGSNNPGAFTLLSAFHAGGSGTWSWLWKLVFTTITLSTGFKGGEVTPLFFIGATLGNTLAIVSGAPVDLFAGLGFIAVFAGATNTPLACTIMGVELFGGEHILYYAIACFLAYFFSGHSGIYSSQRIAVPKIMQAFFTNSFPKKGSGKN